MHEILLIENFNLSIQNVYLELPFKSSIIIIILEFAKD